MKNREKAITLVALVITIIILLILAGITINSLTESGLFENTKLAKEKYENAEKLENATLGQYEDEINKYNIDGTRNGIDDVVLWEGSIINVGENVTLDKSIENYKYLLLEYGNNGNTDSSSKLKNSTILSTTTIKQIGYFPDNYSDKNSHICMVTPGGSNAAMTFKSDKSFILTHNYHNEITVTKLIGIK